MAESAPIQWHGVPSAAEPIDPEDLARARWYRFFARIFAAPPDAGLLQRLADQDNAVRSANEEGADQPLAQAWQALARASVGKTPERIAEEFDGLFLGVGKAPVAVHASWHLSGFLHERPLAELRTLLNDIGLTRHPDSSRTEDHLASLCETMAVLIESGPLDGRDSLGLQRQVFEHYLSPWYDGFTRMIDAHGLANWYAPAGSVMRAFLDVERQAFDFED